MNDYSADILSGLEAWYARENGQYLLANIRDALQQMLDTSFGYHLLQIGCTRGNPLYQASPINHRIYCAARAGEGIGLVAQAAELPLESDSIDTLIAHHCLEFTANPHQVLREMQRVLTPQGHLLLIGFNPYSLHGIGTRLRGLSRRSLWHGHAPVSERRLTDWLHLLGCEVQETTRLYNVPPVGGKSLRQWLHRLDAWSSRHNLPSGGIYVMHAIKQMTALHRPRRTLRLRSERLIGLAVPKPGTAPSPAPVAPGLRGARRAGGEPSA
jgi:SAM-dependent methyltransferase